MRPKLFTLAVVVLLNLTAFSVFCPCARVRVVDPCAHATLTIDCSPGGQVLVDDRPMGRTPCEVSLSAGRHQVVVKRPGFQTHAEKLQLGVGQSHMLMVALRATDIGAPGALAALLRPLGVSARPNEQGKISRAGIRTDATYILWPCGDVLDSGLDTIGIEVDETYEASATLEFRRGNEVLAREPFRPQTLISVLPFPQRVRDRLEAGGELVLALVTDDGAEMLTESRCRIVEGRKALIKLGMIDHDDVYAAHDELTRAFLRTQVLESCGLYSMALCYALQILRQNPSHSPAHRVVMRMLVKLGRERSRLWALSSHATMEAEGEAPLLGLQYAPELAHLGE